jgi:hypothetical protein
MMNSDNLSMTETEGRLARSSLQNDKLAPANANATLTSSYKSTIKNDIHMSPTTTASLTAASGSVDNNEVSKPGTTITGSLLASDMMNDMCVSAAASNTPTTTDMAAPTLNKTLNSTSENGGLVPNITITTAATATPTASDPFFPLHRLPRELQDRIHTYISFNASTWIGSPPLATEQQYVVVIERDNMQKPATFIKTHSNIVLVSKQIRDDFRTAVLRTYMESHRQVEFLLYDFDPKPLRDFFTACSTLQLQTLQKKEKCLVQVHLTKDIRRFRTSPELCLCGLVQSLVMGWVSFCDEVGLDDVVYSFEKCYFFDVQVVDISVSQRVETGPQGWEEVLTSLSFMHLEPGFIQTIGRDMFRGDFRKQNRMINHRWKHY